MSAKKHIHRYYRINDLWACSLPDCTHHMPRNIEFQVVGKKSICWSCGEVFILSDDLMDITKPVCHNCKNDVPDITNYITNQMVK